MATPQFVLTTAGLAAASAATPSGPYIHITEFRLGSGYNYTPVAADSGLHGTQLYSAAPRSYNMITSDTVDIICEVPANIGPFQFGEIGLYLPGGVLFALASWPSLQQKYAIATDNLPHVWRFNCLIKLAQGTAVFQVTTTNQNDLLEVANSSFISGPDVMAQQPNAVIVHELGPSNEPFMLFKDSSTKWSPVKYTYLGQGAIINGGNTTIYEIESTIFGSLDGSTPKRFMVQTNTGEVRLVSSITANTAVLSYSLGTVPSGTVLVYEADSMRVGGSLGNVADYNELRSLVNPIWSTPSGSTPGVAKGWGQPVINSPAGTVPTSGEWTTLTSAITKAATLMNLPTGTDLTGFTSTWNSGNFTKRMRQMSSMSDLANRIAQYGNVVPYSTQDVTTVAIGRTLSNYWTQVHHDIDVNFSNVNDAKVFFNSGGYIGFAVRCSAKNYTQSIQRAMLSQLGTIRFAGTLSESLGPLRITYRDGDGISADFGNCGFYGLSGSRRRVFFHRLPLGTEASKQPDSECLSVEMYATSLSVTHFKLEIWITDSSGSPYYNYPQSDPGYGSYGLDSLLANTWIQSTVLYGKAPITLLGSPGIPTPSIATSPSTQW